MNRLRLITSESTKALRVGGINMDWDLEDG